jgi:hypothetical protein
VFFLNSLIWKMVLVYHIWSIASTISFISSLIMLISILKHRVLWGKVFHQLSALLALFDLISTSSWFFGSRDRNNYTICSLQEYMLQGGMIFKGVTSILICYLSHVVVHTLSVPTRKQVYLSFLCAVVVGSIIIIIAIIFRSGRIFCTNLDHPGGLMIYICTTLAPLFCCAIINLTLYIRMLLHIQLPDQFATDRQKVLLLDTVRKLRIYPALFSIFLIPEMVAFVLLLFGVQSHMLFIICAATISSMGTAVAFNYLFLQRGLYQTLSDVIINRVISSSSATTSNHTDSGIGGRSLARLLRWGSPSNTTFSNSNSNRRADDNGGIVMSDGSSLYTGSNSSAMTYTATNESSRPSYIDSSWDSTLYSVDEISNTS